MLRPHSSEYPPYFHRYIKYVPDGDIIITLEEQLEAMLRLLNSFSEEVSMYRYAPEKWCIKEVIGHVIDTERVFSYRALCFARNDQNHLPGFDQDTYVKESMMGQRSLLEIKDEYQSVRQATIILFRSMDDRVMSRIGQASDYSISVRAIPFIIAGHEMHHRQIIEQNYLHRHTL